MSDSTGNFAAYRQLTPLRGSVVDDLQVQEQLGYQRRAEKREIDEIARQEQDKKDKQRANVLAQIKPQDLYATGSESMDELLYKGVQKAYNKWDDVLPILLEPNKYSDKEVVRANLVASNLNKFTEKTAELDKALREINENYRKDVASGKKWNDPKFEQHFKEGFKNKSLGVNEVGEPVLYFIDENNDGLDDTTGKAGKIGDYISYSDIANGTGLDKYSFEDRINYEATLDDLASQIKPVENKRIKGNKYVTTTGLDETALEERVNSTLFDSDGKPSDILKSFSKEFNIDLNNPQKLKEFKESTKQALRLRAKGGTKEEYVDDPLAWAQFNYSKQKDAKDEVKRTAVEIKNNIKDNFVNNVVSKDGFYTNGIGVSSNKVQFKNLGGDKSGLNSGYIETFTKDKKTGDIVVIGKALKTKGAKFKLGNQTLNFEKLETAANGGNKDAQLQLNQYMQANNYGTFVRRIGEEEVAPLVLQAGYGSVKELKAELDKQNPKNKQETAAQRAARIAKGG